MLFEVFGGLQAGAELFSPEFSLPPDPPTERWWSLGYTQVPQPTLHADDLADGRSNVSDKAFVPNLLRNSSNQWARAMI